MATAKSGLKQGLEPSSSCWAYGSYYLQEESRPQTEEPLSFGQSRPYCLFFTSFEYYWAYIKTNLKKYSILE